MIIQKNQNLRFCFHKKNQIASRFEKTIKKIRRIIKKIENRRLFLIFFMVFLIFLMMAMALMFLIGFRCERFFFTIFVLLIILFRMVMPTVAMCAMRHKEMKHEHQDDKAKKSVISRNAQCWGEKN